MDTDELEKWSGGRGDRLGADEQQVREDEEQQGDDREQDDVPARGACRAAQWLVNQPRGLYDMQDVLQLRT